MDGLGRALGSLTSSTLPNIGRPSLLITSPSSTLRPFESRPSLPIRPHSSPSPPLEPPSPSPSPSEPFPRLRLPSSLRPASPSFLHTLSAPAFAPLRPSPPLFASPLSASPLSRLTSLRLSSPLSAYPSFRHRPLDARLSILRSRSRYLERGDLGWSSGRTAGAHPGQHPSRSLQEARLFVQSIRLSLQSRADASLPNLVAKVPPTSSPSLPCCVCA